MKFKSLKEIYQESMKFIITFFQNQVAVTLRINQIILKILCLDKEGLASEQKMDEKGVTLNIEQQLPHLQLLYALLQVTSFLKRMNFMLLFFTKELSRQTDADALYYLLHSLKYLCLHGECLNYGIRDNEMSIKYCLKALFIPR